MKLEDQQRLWDMMLVQAWTCIADMNILAKQFVDQSGIDTNDDYAVEFLAHLKRVPRESHDFKKPVRAFVSERLPKLSKLLWEGRIPVDDMIRFLSASSLDTATNRLSGRWRRQKETQRNRVRRETYGRKLRRDYEDQFNRMHDHVKETASTKNRH